MALLSPTSADWTATCSMSRGRPPVALSRRRTSWAWVARSTCCPPAERMRRRNSSTAASLQRSAAGRAPGGGPTRTTDSWGWPAVVWAVTTTRASVVLSSIAWRIGPASVASRSRPSSTSRQARPSTARAERAGEGVARGRLGLEALEGGHQHLVEVVRRLRASTHEVGAASADAWRTSSVFPLPGRADDGDPPRLVERLAQRALDLVATEAGGQHDLNLSPSGRSRYVGLRMPTSRRFAGVFSYAEGIGTAQGRVPQPTGRLSGQVAHRRGSMRRPARAQCLGARRGLCAAAYSGAMELVLVLVVLGGLTAVAVAAGKSGKRRELARAEAEVEPVKRLAEEDVTALGVELQDLDIDLAGRAARPGRQRRLPASARLLRVGQGGRCGADPPRGRQARHRDPRGRPLRDGLRARPGRRRCRSRSVVRPASSTHATACRWPTSPGPRRAAPRATSRRVRSTSSACAPAPSPTSAR